MAAKVTFDGPNLLVIIKSGVTDIDVGTDLYSDYKEEVLSGVGDDLSKFPRMWESVEGDSLSPGSVGNNDLGNSKFNGKFFFFNNAAGWRIRPAEEDAEVLIDGNLFPVDPALPFSVDTVGAFTVRLVLQRSVDAIGIVTSGNAPADVADAVWDEALSGHVAAGSAGEAMARLDVVLSSRAAPGDAMSLTPAERAATALAVRAELATELARLDVAVSTRSSHTAAAILDELLAGHFLSDSVGEALALIRGLVQQNYMIDNVTYNASDLLLAGRMRVFPDQSTTLAATDGGAGEGELASFTIETEADLVNPARYATYKVSRTT